MLPLVGVFVFFAEVAQGPLSAQDAAAPAKREIVFAVLQVNTKEQREAFERTQLQLIRSRPSLKLALARDHIAQRQFVRKLSDPVAWLERNLRIDFAQDGKMLWITLSGTERDDLAAIVDSATEVYLQHVETQREKQLKILKDELASEESKLAKLREEVRMAEDDSDLRAVLRLRLLYHERHVDLCRERLAQASVPEIILLHKAQTPHAKYCPR